MKHWRQKLIGVPVRIVSHAHAAHIGRIGPIKEIRGTVAVIEFSTPDHLEFVHVDLRGLHLIPKYLFVERPRQSGKTLVQLIHRAAVC